MKGASDRKAKNLEDERGSLFEPIDWFHGGTKTRGAGWCWGEVRAGSDPRDQARGHLDLPWWAPILRPCRWKSPT